MNSRTVLLSALLVSLTCAVSCHSVRTRDLASTPTAAVSLPGLIAPTRLNQAIDVAAQSDQLDLSDELRVALMSAYARNQQRPLWFDAGLPRAQVQALSAAINDLGSDGLDPRRYDSETLSQIALRSATNAGDWSDQEIATADVQLTLAAVKMLHDLQKGAATPGKADRLWAHAEAIDYGAVVYLAAQADDTEAVMRSLQPQHAQYQRLKAALAHQRHLAQTQSWPTVAEEAHVKPGKSGAEIPGIRERLFASGHLLATNGSEVLDEELMGAIQTFQREHGLADDGIPGKDTLAAMNFSPADRVRQLELNLERWRWLPENLGDTHVLVNVPTYDLTAVEDRQVALQMRVVAGSTATPTPMFQSAMQSVVLSPYWNVPPSILRGEIKPGFAKDPSYLERKNMEVLRNGESVDLATVDLNEPGIRVRQRPGAGNSLGHVKFLFPNEFNVYLHDTPADALFARASRNLSHGCIRLEKPFEMARWVLRNRTEWTDEKIQLAMDSGKEQHVRLESKIPVYLIYQTAWVNEDGTVVFAKDIYGHDKRQTQEFAQFFSSAAADTVLAVN